MTHVAIFGHVNLDRIYSLKEIPKPDTTVEVTESETRFGGTAGNIAAMAAKLEADVKLASFVGHDFPKSYRDHLEALGVDTAELVTKDDYGTPTFWGFADPEGSVLGVIDQGPMRDILNFELLTDCLDDAQMVHFATGRPAYYERIAREANNKNVPIMLDPGQELRALYDAAQLERLLEAASIFVVNEHEVQEAIDKFRYGSPQQLFDHELDALIVTRSAKSVHLYTDKEQLEIPTLPVAEDKVIDPIGAGDAFRGALHAARHHGKDLVTAIRWGNAAASLAIQHQGGQGYLPPRSAIEPLVEQIEVTGRGA